MNIKEVMIGANVANDSHANYAQNARLALMDMMAGKGEVIFSGRTFLLNACTLGTARIALAGQMIQMISKVQTA